MANQQQSTRSRIGVLDLQGGSQEHLDHFRRVGIDAVPVKAAGQFADLAGLVMPGGESTCLRRLLTNFELVEPLKNAHADGMKIWGTCAGAILLAAEIRGEDSFFKLIDITIARNAFGSQLDSFQQEALVPTVSENPLRLTFIRAPKILRTGSDVRILLKIDDYIAAAENKTILATVFHPELTPEIAFHAYFARKCGLETEGAPRPETTWSYTSWMRARRA